MSISLSPKFLADNLKKQRALTKLAIDCLHVDEFEPDPIADATWRALCALPLIPARSPIVASLPGLYSPTYQTAPYPVSAPDALFRVADLIIYPDVSQLKVHHDKNYPNLGGGLRSPITTFSRKSRGRLLLRMAQIHDVREGHFITLTYPGTYPSDPTIFKRDLKVWVQRLRRRYPDARAIWRLEFQRRGAPHYHMLVFGIPDRVCDVREWCALAWYKVVGSGDERHLRAGIRVDRIENRAHAMRYASKYCAKDGYQDLEGDYGRRWGHCGKCDLSPISQTPLTWGQYTSIQRSILAWLNSRTGADGKKLRSAQKAREYMAGVQRNRSWVLFGLGHESQAARHKIEIEHGMRTIDRLLEGVNATYQKVSDFEPGALERWTAYQMAVRKYKRERREALKNSVDRYYNDIRRQRGDAPPIYVEKP
jgi:hypothetical protein